MTWVAALSGLVFFDTARTAHPPPLWSTNRRAERSWNECKTEIKVTGEPNWLGERQPPPYAVISSKMDDLDGHPVRT